MGLLSGVKRAVKRVTKNTKRAVKTSVKVAKKTVTGGLDIKGAATMGLINPVLAVNTHPREALLAGGAVAIGSYAAGATTAAAETTTAAASTEAVAASTGAAVVGSAVDKSFSDKAVDFVMDTAMKNQIAKAQTDYGQPDNYAMPQSQGFNAMGGNNQTALMIVGGVGLLVVGTLIAKK